MKFSELCEILQHAHSGAVWGCMSVTEREPISLEGVVEWWLMICWVLVVTSRSDRLSEVMGRGVLGLASVNREHRRSLKVSAIVEKYTGVMAWCGVTKKMSAEI